MQRSSVAVLSILVLVPLLGLVASSTARAGDGVLEINQARAVAGGVTTGDTPGFPVTLSQRGSYRLTSDLSPGNATGILVTTNDVTLDFNGFRIIGPSIIAGPPNQNYGIDAASFERMIVRNGAVRQVNAGGIRLGPKAIVEGMMVDDTGGVGILAGESSSISGNTVSANQLAGIDAGPGSNISANTVKGNGGGGISSFGPCSISRNTVAENSFIGIATYGSGCSITDNAVGSNAFRGISASDHSIISRNSAHTNGGDGIAAPNSTISDNTSGGNQGHGINCFVSLVTGNTLNRNAEHGLSSDGCSYRENLIHFNTKGTVLLQANGAVNRGDNFCAGPGTSSEFCP